MDILVKIESFEKVLEMRILLCHIVNINSNMAHHHDLAQTIQV
jgi:hypothetical protein